MTPDPRTAATDAATDAGTDVETDVLVVGLGALGSAAAWQLARRGVRVVGLERFALGHVRGASHGDSRIIRLSYHTPAYVRRARAAYAAWAELEADAGTALVLRCGGVDVFPTGAAIPPDDYVASLTAEAVPFEDLDAATARRRWPGLAVPDGARVLFQERTGIVPAARGTATMQERARAHGADLRELCAVERLTETRRTDTRRTETRLTDTRRTETRLTDTRRTETELTETGPAGPPDGVEAVCADGTRVRAASAIVTADAWTNQVLADLDVTVPLTVTKEHVVHLAVPPGTHDPGRFPVWIWMDDPSYYGFPSYGEATVKLGQDCGGDPVDPDTRTFDPDPEYVERLRRFVGEHIPGAGDVVRVTTCLYTLTPDRNFVADRVPGHERVVVGLGAAHGFKFAPWLGGVLADLATTGTTAEDVDGFGLDRQALTEAGAPARWLV